MAAGYRVLTGMNYPPSRRAEPGDVVTDIPAASVPWLLEGGFIEPADAKPAPAPIAADAADGGR